MNESPAPRGTSKGVIVWGLVFTAALGLVLGKLRIDWRGREPVPSIDALFVPALVVLGGSVLVAAVWLRRNWR